MFVFWIFFSLNLYAGENFETKMFFLSYSKDLEKQIKFICSDACPKEIKSNTEKFVLKSKLAKDVLLAKMEKDFAKEFTKAEIEYLDKLLTHPIMRRLYDFKLKFISDAQNQKLMKEELLKAIPKK